VPEQKLTSFLREITTNKKARMQFRKNRKAAMKKAGLSSAHQKVILSRDPKKIARAVAAEQPPGAAPLAFCFTETGKPPHGP
jgi:hypothetical protein